MPSGAAKLSVVARTLCLLGLVFLSVDVYLGITYLKVITKQQQQQQQQQSITSNISPILLPVDSQRFENDQSLNLNRLVGREAVLELFQQAGIKNLDDATIQKLPTWKQVVDLFGERPILVNLKKCSGFRRAVPETERMVGAAGMFSTGTNLVTHLLKQNCRIPARLKKYGTNATLEQLGMRWQVPWGKHTDPRLRDKHSTQHAREINKDYVLPVVTIRNPWTWMQSMCKNNYAARWLHRSQCPNLRIIDSSGEEHWNNLTVLYGAGPESYTSLVHLWNDWYKSYTIDAQYPIIMIRMEDLIFHTKETVTAVCECAGGKLRTDRPFRFIQESAKKDSPGHDTTTGYIEAWIKYSKLLQPEAGFAHNDYEAALEGLDQELMDSFHYQHPPPRAIDTYGV